MTPSEVFSIATNLVLPMWFLMIFLPKWRITTFLLNFKVIPIILAIIYSTYIIIAKISGIVMDFSNFQSVMELFTYEEAALAGWIHYLAFDLLIGMWMLEQNQKIQIQKILMAPCLFFTFMFGPIGFLLFTSIKSFKSYTS